MEGYINEGFLYINYENQTTFKKGEIKDINDNLICIGEIVPRIGSILDEDYTDYIKNLKYWTPLIRGVKIRIYWYEEADEWSISSNGKIYPTEATLCIHPMKIYEQINVELLDRTMCYYAIIERNSQKVILTHIAKNSKETTAVLINHTTHVAQDTAFKHHIPLIHINSASTEEIIIEKNKQENGVLFILKDGQLIEFFNNHYNNVYMLEKPCHIDYHEYYVYSLNKHANANVQDFESYFENEMHYDINHEILFYFPEYKRYFDFYKMKLKKYIEKSVESGIADSMLKDRNTIRETMKEESTYLEIESLKSSEIITKEDVYIDVYELVKNSEINPVFTEELNTESESVDLKKINFARTLIEAHNLEELIQLLE